MLIPAGLEIVQIYVNLSTKRTEILNINVLGQFLLIKLSIRSGAVGKTYAYQNWQVYKFISRVKKGL